MEAHSRKTRGVPAATSSIKVNLVKVRWSEGNGFTVELNCSIAPVHRAIVHFANSHSNSSTL